MKKELRIGNLVYFEYGVDELILSEINVLGVSNCWVDTLDGNIELLEHLSMPKPRLCRTETYPTNRRMVVEIKFKESNSYYMD